jgi:hypothetical protein
MQNGQFIATIFDPVFDAHACACEQRALLIRSPFDSSTQICPPPAPQQKPRSRQAGFP